LILTSYPCPGIPPLGIRRCPEQHPKIRGICGWKVDLAFSHASPVVDIAPVTMYGQLNP
jgi:hypothetical protein